MINLKRPAYISIQALYQKFCHHTPIILILSIAAFLFTYRLESEGLWLDEMTSIEDASLSPLAVYQENQLRPLYYLLLMGWMHFGNSDAWLRLLSVIFAVISVFLIYRLGRRLLGEAEGLIASILLSVSPIFINHAQEIRMYVVSLCIGLAGTLFLANALLTSYPKRPSQTMLAGWALLRLLAIYTVPLNVTLLLPDALVILHRFRRERAVLIRFAKWLLVLVVLWSPSILSVIQESAPDSTFAGHHSGAVPPKLDRLIRPLKFWTVWPFEVQENAIVALFYKTFTLLVGGILGAGLIRKHNSPELWWVSAWFFVPLLPIIAFSYLSIPIWEIRYILFVCPYLFILLAAGFTRLWKQWKIAAVIITLVYAVAVSGGLWQYYTVQNRSDYKFNVQTLQQYALPEDAIVWSSHYLKAVRRYYSGDAKVYWRTIRDVKTASDIQAWMAQFPTEYRRLWLVIDASKETEAMFDSAIANTYKIEARFDYARGSTVMLLLPKNPPPSALLTPTISPSQ